MTEIETAETAAHITGLFGKSDVEIARMNIWPVFDHELFMGRKKNLAGAKNDPALTKGKIGFSVSTL